MILGESWGRTQGHKIAIFHSPTEIATSCFGAVTVSDALGHRAPSMVTALAFEG